MTVVKWQVLPVLMMLNAVALLGTDRCDSWIINM